ncbi:MAG: deoxyribonuclease IV [Deltaproteobacteria bacterium]|nr:MAG: deoxyribonuclease IV [Deltaproteobacteria bacterium]
MIPDRNRLKELFKAAGQTYLGAHFSIAGGIHKALYTGQSYGCTAAQIFTKNATTWKERQLTDDDISEFRRAVADTGITRIAAHTSYLINLASPDREKRDRSRHALAEELIRADALGVPYVVHHPGAHMGSGMEKGVDLVAKEVNEIFYRHPERTPRLLLETTAGQGTGIGHRFEQLAAIIERIDAQDRVGICLDTCHIFAAGYDIRNENAYRETMAQFEAVLGMERLLFIHLNDSLKALGSRVDRHAHIGQGAIGPEGFRLIMTDPKLAGIPKVIETRKGSDKEDCDAANLARLLGLITAPA